MLQPLAARFSQLRNKIRNIISRSKAIADEQDFRRRGKRTFGHISIQSATLL